MIPIIETPISRILAHDAAYWTTISTMEQRDGWRLFHNVDFAPRVDPNHAGDFRAPEGSGAQIVQEIVTFFRQRGLAPAAYVDALATPRDLPEHLLGAGFVEWSGASADLLLYVGPDNERRSHAEVELVATEHAMAEWGSIVEEDARAEQRELLSKLYQREISDPRMTAYLARVQGEAASRCELFSSDGLGRVEAVRTLAAFRGQGLAAAVVRRAVRDSLARNAITYIYAEPGGDAHRLYQRLGFRVVATNVMRGFIR
jgi:GNAT superfamily N-acetyltransferase